MYKQINGVLDAQGFWLKNKFIIKELAFCNDKCTLNYLFDYVPNFQIYEKDHEQISFVTKNIHGLPFRSRLHNKFSPLKVIKLLQLKYGKKFGIKNSQLKTYLERHNIAFVELDMIPKLKETGYTSFNCGFHTNYAPFISRTFLRCALKKVLVLWRLVKKQPISTQSV